MKTVRSFINSIGSGVLTVVVVAGVRSRAADTASTTNASPVDSTTFKSPAALDVSQRLRAVGYQPSDLDLNGTESRLKPEFVGPFPNLIRGHFAKFMDSINPFGHDVPTQARPNSFLIMGGGPPVAGWRNEISHEPVGMSVISISR